MLENILIVVLLICLTFLISANDLEASTTLITNPHADLPSR